MLFFNFSSFNLRELLLSFPRGQGGPRSKPFKRRILPLCSQVTGSTPMRLTWSTTAVLTWMQELDGGLGAGEGGLGEGAGFGARVVVCVAVVCTPGKGGLGLGEGAGFDGGLGAPPTQEAPVHR